MMIIFFLFTTIGLFLFCLYLWKKNKKLEAKIKELVDTSFRKNKYYQVPPNKEEVISIDNLSDASFLSKKVEEEKKPEKILDDQKKEEHSLKKSSSGIEKIPRRVFHSINESNEGVKMKNTSEDLFLEDFVCRSDKALFVPDALEDESIIQDDYLRRLSNRLENELKPKTIELTDYEKKQEETAIISYQELISLKDEGHETIKNDPNQQFLHDLKNFRNHLK